MTAHRVSRPLRASPKPVKIEGDIDTFTNDLWTNLNEDNKVSLFTRFINLKTGKIETRIVNKNK